MDTKIFIAQYYTSNLTHGPYAEKINRKYCEEQQYGYYCEKSTEYIYSILEDRAPTWFKSKLILDVFNKYNPDYVLFLDTDAVVSNFNIRVEEFLEYGYDFIATQDNSTHSLMNAGVFLIKNSDWSKDFLRKWFKLSTSLLPSDVTYKPTVADHDLKDASYFKNRLWMDQTALTYMYNDLEEYRSKMKIIPNTSLNWPVYGEGNFIFHAYAYGTVTNRTLDRVYEKVFNVQVNYKGKTLADLANHFWTDKHFHHNYFETVYEPAFTDLREESKEVVELGVHEGASINIWFHYFQNARITGVDFQIERAKVEKNSRIRLLNYHLSIREDLAKLAKDIQNADIIIDDASHTMKDQQLAFGILFPCLKPGGVYVLEDLHTSYDIKANPQSMYKSDKESITLDLLEDYNKGIKINSDYLTENENLYLNENISKCEIYKLKEYWSYTSLIFKK